MLMDRRSAHARRRPRLPRVMNTMVWALLSLPLDIASQNPAFAWVLGAMLAGWIGFGCASLATDRWQRRFSVGRLLSSTRWTVVILAALAILTVVLLARR